MRLMTFRGKCIAEGELKGKWVYGDVLQKNKRFYITPHANAVNVNGHLGKIIIMHEIDPETVGQCTGIKDSDGTEIYEGDIVLVFITGEYFEIIWDSTGAGFLFSNTDKEKTKQGAVDYYDFEDEVSSFGFRNVGNIYENPELIEVSA